MKRLNYGDIGLETKNQDLIETEFKYLISEFGYVKGDVAVPINTDMWSYVLVLNSDDYLDVEYRSTFNGKIYTREDMQSIQNKLLDGRVK